LLHVPCESLRCELQALDHREIREQLVGQFLRRHLRPDRERRRLNQFACFRRHRLHADQPTAALLDDQLDETACVEVGERARPST